MLDSQTFTSIVENTPLVSIGLCLVFDGQMLLGKRNIEPLRAQWFTPGGRILKHKAWQGCIKSVSGSESGFNIDDTFQFKLMGMWDHFDQNSFIDENVSTHYVNLPHYLFLKEEPILIADDQHDNLS